MVHYLRARGIVWSLPLSVGVVLLAAFFGTWLEMQPVLDHWSRMPAVALGGLAGAVITAPGWHRSDDEVEGSVPRPQRWTEVVISLSLVAVAVTVGVFALPFMPWERGGLEMARNLIGLAGLGLLAASVFGSRLAWVLPFCWAAASYFSVTRVYRDHPSGAVFGWMMYPATYDATWVVAFVLLGLGLAAFAWGGFVPLPHRHPRR